MIETFKFVNENGQEIEFVPVEETKFQGERYLLVRNKFDEFLVLKDKSKENEEFADYEILEDDKAELLLDIFTSLLDVDE